MTIGAPEAARWISLAADAIAEQREHLTELDSAIGDADHGTNTNRGFQAAVAKLAGAPTPDTVGSVFKTVGMTLMSKVGGAGGPLYGTLFVRMAGPAGDREQLDPAEWAAALRAGIEGVQARGKAEPGDKTMLDALLPAADALDAAVQSGSSLGEALRRSADAAEEGMRATVPLVARKGRASYLGERSAGHQDPGATSSHLLLRAAVQAFE